ncbi:MAG: hypothetical protein ACRC7P_02465 [Enterovibrio sp.]
MAGPTGSTSNTFAVLKNRLEQAKQLKESALLNIRGVANSQQQLATNQAWQQANAQLVHVQRALDGEADLSPNEYDLLFNEFSVVAALGAADVQPQAAADPIDGAIVGATGGATAAQRDTVNDFSMLQNSCPEEMLLFAGNRLGVQLAFDTAAYALNQDQQIDLFEAIFMQNLGQPQSHLRGNDARGIAAFIGALAKDQVYVVRTGTQGGAGHYCVVYNEGGMWYAHDSRTRPVTQLTDFSQSITQQAIDRFVVANGTWGEQYGNYSITYCALSSEMVWALAAHVLAMRINPRP